MSFITVKSTTEANCGCVGIEGANDQFSRMTGDCAVGWKAGYGGVGDGEGGGIWGEGLA